MVTSLRLRASYMRRVNEILNCRRDPTWGIVLENPKTKELWRATGDGNFERREADLWILDMGMTLESLVEVLGSIETTYN